MVNGSIKRRSSVQGKDFRKTLRPRTRLMRSPDPPCHNCSYLSAGGERILSMNNRLSLIFLGEARPPIGQPPEFMIFTYLWFHLLLRETRLLLNPRRPVRKCKMWSGSWMTEKCQQGKMSQKVERVLFWSSDPRCYSTLIMSNSSQTVYSLNKLVLFSDISTTSAQSNKCN